jgi:hypothetical protein
MSMVLPAAASLHRHEGGFYDDGAYRRTRVDHVEGILELFLLSGNGRRLSTLALYQPGGRRPQRPGRLLARAVGTV